MLGFLQRAEFEGLEVLVTDYCWDTTRMDDAYALSELHGFVGFAAPSRELDEVPSYPTAPSFVHAGDVGTLAQVRNFLYLINPHRFASQDDFVRALRETNYDLLILDAEFDDTPLSASTVASLKTKANGGSRLVLCYLSIGEAEDYRSYWRTAWREAPPEWLLEENPDWPGNYPVQYWDPNWQAIILAAVDRILEAGFDGLYLDRIDMYEEFG